MFFEGVLLGRARGLSDILANQPERALDNLERLLPVPYCVSPAWLKIDPNFDPLRRNSRFQKLVAAVK